MIFFELLPFFKILDPEILQLGMIFQNEKNVLKLHVWIPHGKIADAYFLFFGIISPCKITAL